MSLCRPSRNISDADRGQQHIRILAARLTLCVDTKSCIDWRKEIGHALLLGINT